MSVSVSQPILDNINQINKSAPQLDNRSVSKPEPILYDESCKKQNDELRSYLDNVIAENNQLRQYTDNVVAELDK